MNYAFGSINKFAGGGSGSTQALKASFSFNSVYDTVVDGSRGIIFIAQMSTIWEVNAITGDMTSVQMGNTPITPTGICLNTSMTMV